MSSANAVSLRDSSGKNLWSGTLPTTRIASLQWYTELFGDIEKYPVARRPILERNLRAWLCRNDLFYLLVRGLKRTDANHDWIFDRCREVQAEPNGYLDLWFRGGYKSSVITFALTIQDILNDPEVTFGIFAHTRPIAKAFLKQIKREFEHNIVLRQTFPEVLWQNPAKEAPQWSEDGGIIVRRKTNPKEATIEAWGLVDGQPTSKHFRRRVYDDTVSLESVSTSEQIQKTIEAWEMSLNLAGGESIERYVGTRYAIYDPYAAMLSRGVVKPRIYPATHNGKMDGKPVFLTPEQWEEKKKSTSRRIISSQLLQNPLADEDATFKPEWLKAWEVRPRTLNIAILCDPSRGRTAESDNTAMIVLGRSASNGIYLLDGYCHRMTLSQRWINLRDLYWKWSAMRGVQLVWVGYERFGAQSDDEYFEERMKLEKGPNGESRTFQITELNWPREGGTSKRDRVERLEPDFRNSRFMLPLSVWHDGKPCYWRVDMDTDSKTQGTVLWRDVEGFTKKQTEALQGGAEDLICKAIKRVDSDNRVYDLTDKFMQEYLTFPFGEYKDAIDAASRLHDIELPCPKLRSGVSAEDKEFWDG